jgi:hypothetical protein
MTIASIHAIHLTEAAGGRAKDEELGALLDHVDAVAPGTPVLYAHLVFTDDEVDATGRHRADFVAATATSWIIGDATLTNEDTPEVLGMRVRLVAQPLRADQIRIGHDGVSYSVSILSPAQVIEIGPTEELSKHAVRITSGKPVDVIAALQRRW